MNRTGRDYDDMMLEELQQEAWETLMDTDRIDGPLTVELEKIREALNRKRPVDYLYTPEESWERFLEKCADEDELARSSISAARAEDAPKPGRYRTVLRTMLVAAVIFVLLAGATFAAGSFGYDLWAWIPRWNVAAGRFEPAAAEVPGKPVPAALAELGITEPVYPNWLPEGFALVETRYSEDPLILVERYSDESRSLAITVTPIESFRTAVYQKSGTPAREYSAGQAAYYLFENAGNITGVWYTEHYAASVSGSITMAELKKIINSVCAG